MASSERVDDPNDDFTAEVSDLRRGAGRSGSAPFLSAARLPPRQRLLRLATLIALPALALLVVLGANPALRAGLGSIFPGVLPSATTPAVTPGDDLFYLLPNPPGVDVLLDGHILAQPPAPGDPHPLKLKRGQHTFAWRSRMLPFTRLACHVSVPPSSADSCPLVPARFLPYQLAGRRGSIIATRESLDMLDAVDAAQLSNAIQGALDAVQSTALVEPGEPYVPAQVGLPPTPAFARQPLRAVRGYQLVRRAGYPEPCILAQPAIPCRFPGQDCATLCTVAQPPASVAASPRTWIAAALVSSAWSYYTADGNRAIAVNVPESYGVQLATLRITYDAGIWRVSAIVGHTPGLDVADDLTCDPARYAVSQTSAWSFMVTNPPPGAQVRFISGASPADGCAVSLSFGEGTGTDALFLQRFGVLMTVNENARNPSDNLPVASPQDQALAQQMIAQLPA